MKKWGNWRVGEWGMLARNFFKLGTRNFKL
jgi:hypothetical protein